MPRPIGSRRPRPAPRVATVIPLRRPRNNCTAGPRPPYRPYGGDAA